MKVIQNPDEMQAASSQLRRQGKRIGLVPTMGFFHEGHLSLMRLARTKTDILVVSNFVNPTQFGPNEDLEAYPRNFESDCRKAEAIPVDIMFAPRESDMYPEGFRTFVEVEGWGERLCGQSRPIHFRGVATIVLKLFNVVQPEVAVFGWKDAQQFLLLRRMVKDLNLPIDMIGGEIIREEDGLAMSSRNKYLSARERKEAVALSRSLFEAGRMIREQGQQDAEKIKNYIREEIEKTETGGVDYVEIVSMKTLEPIEKVIEGDAMIALAAFFGKARLIDNMRI